MTSFQKLSSFLLITLSFGFSPLSYAREAELDSATLGQLQEKGLPETITVGDLVAAVRSIPGA